MHQPGEFVQQIETAKSLIATLFADLSTKSADELIAYVCDKQTGRAFFVALLSSDFDLEPPGSKWMISVIEAKPEILVPLLVKNIVMSTAMTITHRRKNDQKMQEESSKVFKRAFTLTTRLNPAIVKKEVQAMKKAISTMIAEKESDSPQFLFLSRWKYDSEQLEAAAGVLEMITAVLSLNDQKPE
ncbi:MAG: hypothetical protein K8F91_19575 [Candidatus Obscuribacterales bacterium]|nr:hypothetical protein [Candidatus Obscuribacterales bacterium]